ncbi:tetratricopeptide repeat protein [Nonomuraea sp. NPDC049152]|uniref:tetratricopeptide repeat protein n=1 Tax=Nonomuraea sp. NPDC049152 TaxID=3154350 RepID=UPI0033F72BDB
MNDLERASDLLRFCWRAVVYEEGDASDLDDAFTETRRLYDAARPDDLAVTTGLAVLTFTRLQAHVHEDLQVPLGWGEWNDDGEPLPVLEEDDTFCQRLAGETMRAARRALELDPSDSLSALMLALTLELLGDTDAAISAYRETLRMNPDDGDARLRLEALGAQAPPDPENPQMCHHSQGFFLMRSHARVTNSEWSDWVWLFTDHTQIRPMADDNVSGYYWAGSFGDGDDDRWNPRSDAFNPSPDNDLHLTVHRPGELETTIDLYRALRRASHGTVSLDWSTIPLPGPLTVPLSRYRPVRVGNTTYFSGVNGPD